MREAFATIVNRELLTCHDASAYFAETYGGTMTGAMQDSDFEGLTPGEVAVLIDQVEAAHDFTLDPHCSTILGRGARCSS
jgi:ABC-type Zn uptake system ZnuABC Zn-binding protein ZnuA